MSHPLDDIKTSHTLHKVVPAEDYNRVRLALKRIHNPLQFELISMRCLEVVLNDKYWLCFDCCVDSQPIMAWTNFEVSGRSSLNAPVECELRLYHHKAGMVMGEVLESIGHSLETMLDTKQNNV